MLLVLLDIKSRKSILQRIHCLNVKQVFYQKMKLTMSVNNYTADNSFTVQY